MSEKHCRKHHSYEENRGGNICNPGIECDFCRDEMLRAESSKAWGEVKSLRAEITRLNGEVEKEKKRYEELEERFLLRKREAGAASKQKDLDLARLKDKLAGAEAALEKEKKRADEAEKEASSRKCACNTPTTNRALLAASKQKDLDMARLKDKLEGAEADGVKAVKDLDRKDDALRNMKEIVAVERSPANLYERIKIEVDDALAPSPTKDARDEGKS